MYLNILGELIVQIILRLVLSSVVVCLLWGCEAIQFKPYLTEDQPTNQEAEEQKLILEKPLVWISQLEKENQTLKNNLERLTIQLDQTKKLIAANPKMVKNNNIELSKLVKEKKALEKQVKQRTQQLAELRQLVKVTKK